LEQEYKYYEQWKDVCQDVLFEQNHAHNAYIDTVCFLLSHVLR